MSMHHVRWHRLMKDDSLSLTPAEIAEGWHFCNEFDGLLVKGNPAEQYCGSACVEGESTTKLEGCSSPGCGYPDGKPCIKCGHIEPTPAAGKEQR